MTRVLSRAWRDWSGRSWLPRGVITAGVGLAIGLGVARLLEWRKLTAHYPVWLPGLIGGVGALLIWGIVTFIASLLKAPLKLLAEQEENTRRLQRELERLEAGLEIDDRLEIRERPNFNRKPDDLVRQKLEEILGRPLPEHQVNVSIRAKSAIASRGAFLVDSTAPIYYASASRLEPPRTVVPYDVIHLGQDRILVKFRQLSAGSVFSITLYSPREISVKRIKAGSIDELSVEVPSDLLQ